MWGRRLAVVASALLASCAAPDDCPVGGARDDARAARALAALAADAEGSALAATAGARPICWVDGPSGVALGDRLQLEVAASDAEAAARLAHLARHLVHGVPLAEGCGALALARAEREEREAHALEDRVRRRLGLAPADPAALAEVLRAYRDRCAAPPVR